MLERTFLVTGTDTGIGKTTAACAIAAALRSQGVRMGVVKPVETGCEAAPDGGRLAKDAELLQFFSGCDEPPGVICPCRLREPLAPLVAARREGLVVDTQALHDTVRAVAGKHDVTLVEGAGGLLVPLTDSTTFAGIARDWGMPLIVVVGNRLGAVNHAMLTIEIARQRGLQIAGYVVNSLSADPGLAEQTNAGLLRELIGPPIGQLPWFGPLRRDDETRLRIAAGARNHLDLSGFTNLPG